MRTFARIGLVPVWPVWSVAIARKSYRPSLSAVVSSDVPHGVVVSLAIVTHEPPPAGRRSKSTWAVSGSDEAVSETMPLRFEPGSASVGVGSTLSTVTFRMGDVAVLPAMSSTTTWIVAGPSEPVVVFQLCVKGAPVSVASSPPWTKNLTEAIGDVTSEADAAIAIVPDTSWPSVGAPTSATSGAVLSTTLSGKLVVVTLSALSVIWMRRS